MDRLPSCIIHMITQYIFRPREKLSFGHREAREGDLTSGDYRYKNSKDTFSVLFIEVSLFWTQVLNCPRVLLPDGRTQVVEYKVEGKNTGFIASVR